MYGDHVRVDSWLLFVFTSTEPWIRGDEDSTGRRADFLHPPPPFHLHFGSHHEPALPSFAAQRQTHCSAVRRRQTEEKEKKDREVCRA